MEWWQIYLLTRLEGLRCLFVAVSIVSSIAIMFLLINGFVTRDSYSEWASSNWASCSPGNRAEFKKKYEDASGHIRLAMRVFIPLAAVFATLAVFTPKSSDVALIIAGHWAMHNEEMKKLPDNVLKTLNSVLEKAQEAVK